MEFANNFVSIRRIGSPSAGTDGQYLRAQFKNLSCRVPDSISTVASAATLLGCGGGDLFLR